jgi:hypothetical protein
MCGEGESEVIGSFPESRPRMLPKPKRSIGIPIVSEKGRKNNNNQFFL